MSDYLQAHPALCRSTGNFQETSIFLDSVIVEQREFSPNCCINCDDVRLLKEIMTEEFY
jgi:hypothetical protein